jgi:hypothetical protein
VEVRLSEPRVILDTDMVGSWEKMQVSPARQDPISQYLQMVVPRSCEKRQSARRHWPVERKKRQTTPLRGVIGRERSGFGVVDLPMMVAFSVGMKRCMLLAWCCCCCSINMASVAPRSYEHISRA